MTLSQAERRGAPPALRWEERHVFHKAHVGPIHVARFNSHGKYVLSGGQDGKIKLWNAKVGPGALSGAQQAHGSGSAQPAVPIQSYSGHSREVLAVDISSDNGKFASAGADKAVLVWDVPSATVLGRFSAHASGTKINDVRFAAGDSVLAAAGFDTDVRLYDLRAKGAWKPIMELKDAKDAITCLSVSADKIYTGSVDGCLRVYDLRQGQLRTDVIDHPIVSLTPGANHATVLVSTLDSTHRLLDMSDGTLLQAFQGHVNESYRCHSSFAADEAAIVAGDDEGQVYAWDVLTGTQSLLGNASTAGGKKAVLWTEQSPAPGDADLLTASADGILKVWCKA